MSGRDCIGIAKTGSGGLLPCAAPALLLCCPALPLRCTASPVLALVAHALRVLRSPTILCRPQSMTHHLYCCTAGKTLAFVLPMLRHVKDQPPLAQGDGPVALCMAPTRELVTQVGVCSRVWQRLAG